MYKSQKFLYYGEICMIFGNLLKRQNTCEINLTPATYLVLMEDKIHNSGHENKTIQVHT